MRLASIRDVFPTLKITYENGCLYEEPMWLGQMFLNGVQFNKSGRYGGCVYNPQGKLELMFTVRRIQERLHIEEIFGKFVPFVCSIDEVVSALLARRE